MLFLVNACSRTFLLVFPRTCPSLMLCFANVQLFILPIFSLGMALVTSTLMSTPSTEILGAARACEVPGLEKIFCARGV